LQINIYDELHFNIESIKQGITF